MKRVYKKGWAIILIISMISGIAPSSVKAEGKTQTSNDIVSDTYSEDSDIQTDDNIQEEPIVLYELKDEREENVKQFCYENKGNTELHYFYDTNGSLKGIQKVDASGTVTSYYVVTNTRGDVTRIYNEAGNLQVQYTYDAWGKCPQSRMETGMRLLVIPILVS